MSRRKVPIRQSEMVRRFSQRLRELRLGNGMTQVELARSAQVTVSYVSRLESAKIAPGVDMVERLAFALGSSIADLLPAAEPLDTLIVLKEQAKRMHETLMQKGDRETFLRLNPFLSLLVEAISKR